MSAPLGLTPGTIAAALGASFVKTTVILLVAAIVVGCWRGASAARRHMVWLAAVIACGITLIASSASRSVAVNVPPRLAALAQAFGVAGTIGQRTLSLMGSTPSNGADTHANETRFGETRMDPTSATGGRDASTIRRWQFLIVSVWIAGLSLLLIRLIAGARVVSRAGRRFRAIEDPAWLTELRSVERLLSSSRTVELLQCDVGMMPVVFGLRSPRVAIPADACDWSAEQRRIVLTHEVAHVVRGDVVLQMLTDVVCALLWFQPLIWFARRQLRAAAEGAADDCVLLSGTAATSYAAQLLGFARSNAVAPLAASATAGLFANSEIERRFRAMLDTTRSRASASRATRSGAAVLACILGTAAGTLRFVPPAGAQTAATPAQSPALSGTWTADTMDYAGHTRSAKFAVSIEQTRDTIRIVWRGPMQDLVGRTGTQDAEFRLAMPVDGTAGKATLTYGGASYDGSVKAEWRYGTTLVTTVTGTRMGYSWAEQDRWTLGGDGSLEFEPKSIVTLDSAYPNGTFTFETTPIEAVRLTKAR